MVKNRIAYAAWLLAVVILHIFGNEFGTRVILYASILAPAVLIFLAWRMSSRMKIKLEAPAESTCGDSIRVLLHPQRSYVKCRLLCENQLTGEKWESNDFSVELNHCGLYAFTLLQPMVTDMFGLSVWKINNPPKTYTIVMPKRADVPQEISMNMTKAADSDEYSMHHSGDDPSETYAIREYIPGDSLKSIHWKLSNKTNQLLVRELGMPIEQNILILLETSVPKDISAERINDMASTAYNLSHKLILDNQPHRVGWLDTTTLEYQDQRIAAEAEVNELFYKLLANTIKECGTTAALVCDKMEYYDVIYISWSNFHET